MYTLKLSETNRLEDCPIFWKNFVKYLQKSHPEKFSSKDHISLMCYVNSELNLHGARNFTCEDNNPNIVIFDTEEDFVVFKLKFS